MRRNGSGLLACASACLIVTTFGVASGQTPRGAQPSATQSSQDDGAPLPAEQTFVSQAAMANMAEIQIGHLASEKAQSAAVKKFAKQMVEDHIKAQNELADAALGGGIQWPKILDANYAATKARLMSLSGLDFDREYLRAMMDGHRDVEKALAGRVGQTDVARASNKTAPASADAELTANVTQWSAKTLPTVRAHMQKAEEVSATLTSTK